MTSRFLSLLAKSLTSREFMLLREHLSRLFARAVFVARFDVERQHMTLECIVIAHADSIVTFEHVRSYLVDRQRISPSDAIAFHQQKQIHNYFARFRRMGFASSDPAVSEVPEYFLSEPDEKLMHENINAGGAQPIVFENRGDADFAELKAAFKRRCEPFLIRQLDRVHSTQRHHETRTQVYHARTGDGRTGRAQVL